MLSRFSVCFVLMTPALFSADPSDPQIEALRVRLEPILKKYFPDSKLSAEGQTLSASANLMTFQIHNVDKTGRIQAEARAQLGPTDTGFMLSVTALKEPSGGAAVRPQASRGPYWETHLGLLRKDGSEIVYNFSYGVNTNKEFMKEIYILLEANKKK